MRRGWISEMTVEKYAMIKMTELSADDCAYLSLDVFLTGRIVPFGAKCIKLS